MHTSDQPRKKICFIVYDLSILRGDVRAAVMVANELCAYHDVELLSMLGEKVHGGYRIDDRVKCTLLGWPEQRILSYGRRIQPVQRELAAQGFSLAILVGTFIGYIFSRWRWPAGCRCIFWDHGALRNQRDVKTVLVRFFASRRCDTTVVLTDRNLRDYRKFFHVRPSHLRRIYNWIERTEGVCDPAARRILSVGRVDSEKGYDLAVKVAQKVLPGRPDWTWHIYGDGAEMEKIRHSICDSGLQEQMILEGTSNQIDEAYRHSSMLVLPSYREGLPLVLLEALNYALPAVSFDIPTGPAEIITDGEDGYLICPYDTDEMAEKLGRLMDDIELRRALSQKTQRHLSRFDKEKIVRDWLRLVDTATAAPSEAEG